MIVIAKPIHLTPTGLALISHSANFREAKQLYDLRPGEGIGNRRIGVDPEGHVFTELHQDHILYDH